MGRWNRCPGCGAAVSSAAEYCPVCGHAWTVKCLDCGRKWRFWKSYRFCPACGAPVETR